MNKARNQTSPSVRDGKQSSGAGNSPFGLHGFDAVALVLCLLAAVVIWLYATNVNQTLSEKDIYVTVNANREIEAKGYNIIYGDANLDYSQIIVKLTVTGTQAALAKYDDDQYLVKLDTDSIDSADDYAFRFVCELPGSDVSVKSISPTYVSTPTVHVDKIISKTVELRCEYTGGIPSGLRMGDITTKDGYGNVVSAVTIRGPEQVVNLVGAVAAQVNLNGYQTSFETKCKTFELVMNDGTQESADEKYVSIEPSEINVYIQILCSDRQIPFTVKYSGGTAGYKYSTDAVYADDGSEVSVVCNGDTALFAENQTAFYDLGNINDVTDRIEITVGDITVPDGLELVTSKERVIIITVKRELVDTGAEE